MGEVEAGWSVSAELGHKCGWSGRVSGRTVERDDGSVVARWDLEDMRCPGCGEEIVPPTDPQAGDDP